MSMEMVDSSEGIVLCAPIEEVKYRHASNVNVSNFVSVKLSCEHNYEIMKAQMLCLMERQQMRGIIDTEFDMPEVKSVKIIRKYDSLAKGCIFGSVCEDIRRDILTYDTTQDVWEIVATMYGPHQGPFTFKVNQQFKGARE
ncbi:Ankyrin repeat-containing protein [Artemisia annua]|uniref:Ankyrin repeat-containing protein n=1 Tax=Artemisia annua TaxID=35608 RepID=A0A2U1MW99_ARTAN|nr:Ankyrin repeat-containing protein [Artemisia annua]